MFTLFLIFVVSLLFFRWLSLKPRNFPPGPPSLPIIGSAPFVKSDNFHFYLEKIKKRYGPVTGFIFGSRYVIAVSGAKEVREVLSREEFQGRPDIPYRKQGIIFTEGNPWTVQRRFTLRHLRSFGFGKRSVEGIVLEEINSFFERTLRKEEIVQISGLFTLSTINILWSMMGGERFSDQDEELKSLLNLIQRRFRTGNVTGGLSVTFPILRKLFPKAKVFETETVLENTMENFLEKALTEHKRTKTDEPRDFIDVYLTELEKKNLDPSFNEETLKNICFDLFNAGSESVGNSLGFCILYCILYPEWQEKLYQEIMSYGENDSRPYLEAKKSFPKVEAFLSEVMRCNTIASLTVPHKAVKDTSLNGYFIPKDSMIIVSLWSILQDKDHWEDPENFRPERFLDENGNYKKDDTWLPFFGMGKRICPGESLARSIIFVYVISLLKEFKFSIPEGQPRPSTVCLPGFTNAPRPFEVKVTRRT